MYLQLCRWCCVSLTHLPVCVAVAAIWLAAFPSNAVELDGPSPIFLNQHEARRHGPALEALKYLHPTHFHGGVEDEGPKLAKLLRIIGKSQSGPICNTCAIVGAAGSLATSKTGAEIDAHTCVFRVNMAITDTFEKHVGKKHTVHVWGLPTTPGNLGEMGFLKKVQNQLAEHSKSAQNLTVFYFATLNAVERALELASEGKLPLERMRIYHPSLLLELCKTMGMTCDHHGGRPSTGIMTAYLAMRLCTMPPRLYGFDANTVPFHYYDPPDHVCDAKVGARLGGQGAAHNFDHEREQLLQWSQEGHISLWRNSFSPKPNATECDIPKVMHVSTKYEELAGYYAVQSYVVNGKAVYERKDSRGADFFKMLYYSLCDTGVSEITGAWVILPHQVLMISQKQTPGQDGTCQATAYSIDFRPETPEKSKWFIAAGDGGFSQEYFNWRVIKRY